MKYSINKMHVLSVAVALAISSVAAVAQVKQAAPDSAKSHMQKLDVNKDGVIDRAEAAKAPRLAKHFDQLDTNKDGKLSADERSQMRGKHQRGARGDGHGRMMSLDTDNDGRISRAEAAAGNGKMAERFDQMDVNKDGYIDRADRQARMAQQRAEFFKGADANRDGRVTRDEFIVEHGARSAERRARWAQRADTTGKQMPMRQAPTDQQKIEFAGKAFDRMDVNKDGALTRAEFDAFKGDGQRMRHGKGHRAGGANMHPPKS